MGVDRNVHTGVYLIVDGAVSETIERVVNTYSNEDCFKNKDNKDLKDERYCSACGSVVAPKTYQKMFTINARSFLNDLIYDDKFEEDELCWTDPMGCGGGVFIPNYRTPFEKERRSAEKDPILERYDDVTDLTGINSADEIFWFREKYEDLINQFRDKFGKDNVRVGWGVVKWYS